MHPGADHAAVRCAPRAGSRETDDLAEFRAIWTAAMGGFQRNARPGDVLVFAPELLSGLHYCARMFTGADGALIEESDRYAQPCFTATLRRNASPPSETNPDISRREQKSSEVPQLTCYCCWCYANNR